jgi:hypothetical protein
MPDLTSELLPRLQAHKLPGLESFSEFIHPKYEDQSILNIPSTICAWLGAPGLGADSLSPEITSPLGSGIRRVILILVDALAFHRLQKWMTNAPVWGKLIREGVLAPLTSVVPSTTSSALTSLWTGRSPATHGIIGYEMWLKEYGIVSNMITHAPIAFRGAVGSLELAGFSPDSFLLQPTLGSHLKAHGVKSYSFTHRSIANSGLSRMLMRDVEVRPFSTPASMWVSIRNLIEGEPDKRMYIWSYWGQVDGISHFNGPDDEGAAAEFSHFSAAFETFFYKKLSPEVRKDTLVILTADHGQTATPLNPNNVLSNHPVLNQHLRIKPACENRLACLYPRPGQTQAVQAYFSEHWPERFQLITQETALQAGLFGPGPHHPDLRDRIGDLIAIARQEVYLWWANEADFLLGRHGSLHHQDMLVPFLAARL